MRIAVLGSTGYLGTRVVSRFAADPSNEIVCVHRVNSNLEELKRIKGNLIYCLSDYVSLKSCFCKSTPPYLIINASCSYMRGASEEQIMESNMIFPLRVLNLALDNPQCQDVKYISIGSGLPDNFNIYTFSKSQLNQIGRFFAEQKKLHYVNLVLQNYYGPFEKRGRFLSDCIAKMAQGEPIMLTHGEQKRDFIYIDDVLDAIELIASHTGLPHYLDIPLGSGEAPSIKELICYLKKLLGSSSELCWGAIPLRPNEPSICADLSIYHLLGGKIKYDWKTGIKHMLEEMNYEIVD